MTNYPILTTLQLSKFFTPKLFHFLDTQAYATITKMAGRLEEAQSVLESFGRKKGKPVDSKVLRSLIKNVGRD